MPTRLVPSSERGDVLAAGAVVIATFAVTLEFRFSHDWAAGVRFVVVGLLAALIAWLAVEAPLEEAVPRPYQAILNIVTFILVALALGDLADALGADGQFSGAGTVVWVGLLLIALAAWFATTRRSPIMTLLGAATAVIVVNAFFDWASDVGTQTHRWLLLLCALALAVGAVALRDLHRRHAVSLIDVAGLSIAVLGATLAIAFVFGAGSHSNGPAGWELVLLVFGFGLVAYGAVDRERVPGFLGALLLALFVVVAGLRSDASLLWWPILLLALGGALLAVGLRPREPLPPEPAVPPTPPAPPTAPTAVAEP